MRNKAFFHSAVSTLIFVFAILLPRSSLCAPWSKENAAWNVNMNPDGSDPSRYYGEWPGHKYNPSPEDWRKIAIYHLMTDRFSDGDPRNNEGQYGGYDPGRIDTRHGGDFKGLTSKLDYIKSLGFDAILISPIFQNPKNGYYGYDQLDFTLLDERLGTLAEFRALVGAAHQRGMYVIVDIVVNHLSSLFYNEGYSDSAAPFRFHRGEYRLLARDVEKSYADFKVDNNFDFNGKYCEVYGHDGKRFDDSEDTGTFSNSDFHHNGDLKDYFDAWQINLGQIYGQYNDLRLCSERVQKKIIAMTQALISSTDIDAIRIDTPMQVPLPFFKQWTPAVKEHAAKLGKKDFFMFGELYAARGRAATMVGRGKTPEMYDKDVFISDRIAMDSGIHYGFYKSIVIPVIRDQSRPVFTDFRELFDDDKVTYDLWDPIKQKVNYRMLNFFNNHDQRRLSTAADGFEKSRLATVLIAFWPGIPLYYYGDEQAFSSYGTALDGHGREDMMTSVAWERIPRARKNRVDRGDSFDMTSPDYLFVQRLFWIRKTYSDVLEEDDFKVLSQDERGRPGVLIFERRNSSGTSRLIVALNTSGQDRDADLKFESKNGKLTNALNSSEEFNFEKSATGLSLHFKPFEAKILVHEYEKKLLPPFIVSVFPQHDQVVDGEDVQARLNFSVAMDEQSVLHSLRFNDTPVTQSAITFSGNEIIVRLKARPGINHIEVGSSAKALSGGPLPASFITRFRLRTPESILSDAAATYDRTLINSGTVQTKSAEIQLNHKALGASMFRVLNSGQAYWSPWKPFSALSSWTLPSAPGWRDVSVQYWADGSASYFVNSGIDFYIEDGITAKDFKK